MPKPRKPSRSSRRRRPGRSPLVPPAGPISRPIEPSVSVENEALDGAPVEDTTTVQGRMASRAADRATERVRERSARRQMSEDYGYVRKDLRRIVVLATAVIIAIVVLSFFLP